MRRWLALGAAAIATAGAALAFAQGGGAPAEPAPWSTRPEVPGAARTLVPFGVETTPAGPRAWALGRAGDATVVLSRAPGGGWSAARLAAGRPVGGEAPQHAGEMTADGHGAVLLAEPTRLFTRAPGAAFTAAPDPGAALASDEQLVGEAARPPARCSRSSAATTRPRSSRRRPPTASAARSCVWTLTAGIASRSTRRCPFIPSRWPPPAPGARGCSRRPATASSCCAATRRRLGPWREGFLGAALGPDFDDALLDAVAKVEVSAPPADPLTATSDGLWIDLRVTPPGATAPVDLTERLKVTEAPDTARRTARAEDP